MGKLKSFGVEEGKGRYYEEIVYSTALLYNIIDDTLSTYLRSFDLTIGKFNILMVIKHQGEAAGINQAEVSKKLIVTPSNMTKLIDKLEEDGLVKRNVLARDRRVNILKVTARGSALLDQAWPEYVNRLKRLVDSLNASDQKELSKYLRKWLGSFRR